MIDLPPIGARYAEEKAASERRAETRRLIREKGIVEGETVMTIHGSGLILNIDTERQQAYITDDFNDEHGGAWIPFSDIRDLPS